MDSLSLAVCVAACAKDAEFVSNWLRLRGYTMPVTPMEKMIDDASGYGDEVAKQFIADVADLVWSRIAA